MSLSADQFRELLNGGRETRSVEFKRGRPRTDSIAFAFVARAVLAMSNLQFGGWVLLGVEDDGHITGLSPSDLATWTDHDDVSASLNAYADPFIHVDIEHVNHEGLDCVALRVHEFAEVPVLARKDSAAKSDGKIIIRQGACYVRARLKPASIEAPTQTEMRELLDIAADKMLKRFLTRAGAAGVLLTPTETDMQKFEKELAGFR